MGLPGSKIPVALSVDWLTKTQWQDWCLGCSWVGNIAQRTQNSKRKLMSEQNVAIGSNVEIRNSPTAAGNSATAAEIARLISGTSSSRALDLLKWVFSFPAMLGTPLVGAVQGRGPERGSPFVHGVPQRRRHQSRSGMGSECPLAVTFSEEWPGRPRPSTSRELKIGQLAGILRRRRTG